MLAALHARDPTNPTYDLLVILKFMLIVDGIYLWEFVTTLDYEWSILRGRRSYGWTIWIYEIARISTLTSVVMNLVYFSAPQTIVHCQVWFTFTWIIILLSLSGGSLLIVLRIFAIWKKSKVALAIASSLWLVNLGFLISGVVRIHAVWNPVIKTCRVTNIDIISQISLISLFVTDFLLLLIMLAGLLRLRRGGSFPLVRLLWRQGLIWFSISTVTEFLVVLFLILNLNDTLHNLFLFPCQVALVTASTRLYRALVNFSSPVDSIQLEGLGNLRAARSTQNTSKDAPVLHLPSSRLEVTVHKSYEEHAMTPYASSDRQLKDNKPHEITFDESMEDRAEK